MAIPEDPLFDMHGRVIGINSRIGPSTSFNLHTPIDAYTDVWEQLLAGEDFILHSGALRGVQGEQDERGLKLTKVWPEEPAGRAGLREGDILLSFQSPTGPEPAASDRAGGLEPSRKAGDAGGSPAGEELPGIYVAGSAGRRQLRNDA